MSDRFIEVFGEAEYLERPYMWLIDISLSTQAVNENTKEYKNKLVKILLNEGIQKDELFYAGAESCIPWWKKNKAGLNLSHKVTIKTKDRYRAYRAIEKIEELNKINKRIILQIHERSPSFKACNEDILQARKEACENALDKAKNIAENFGLKIGTPIEIQEFDKVERASGNYGDYDFGRARSTLAKVRSGSLGEQDEEIELKSNSRIVYLRYRMKFLMTGI